MYTLLSGAWKYYFQRDEFCILILGLDNAGKTTFLEQTKIKFNPKYVRDERQLQSQKLSQLQQITVFEPNIFYSIFYGESLQQLV